MTGEGAVATAEVLVPGRTTFTARALQRVAIGIAHDIARVSARDVAVQLSDQRGALRVTVTVPVATGRAVNVIDSSEELRRGLVEGMRELAGREVRTVDVRYAGVRRISEKRVR